MNMRKIIAVLSAVLMLCSVLPMGAMVSAAPDVAWSKDFEDGQVKFNGGATIVEDNGNKYMKWTATGSWSSSYMTATAGFEQNTTYEVTFKAKGSVGNNGMNLVLQDTSWSKHTANTFYPTTEWKEYSFTLNTAEIVPDKWGGILVKFQDTGASFDLFIDDIVIAKPDPYRNVIVNGDFEAGNYDGWKKHQTVTVEAAAAHDGNYGVHFADNGTWGGIFDQTIPVEAGKTYEVSFWLKVNKFGVNLQLKDGNENGAMLFPTNESWYDYNRYSNWTLVTRVVTPSTNAIFLNFCGGGGQNPDPAKENDIYVDSFSCKLVKDPSFDGYLYNGDFETGNINHWENLSGNYTVAMVEGNGSDNAISLTASGQYNQLRQKIDVEPNTTYVYRVTHKNANGIAMLVKDENDQANIVQPGISSGDAWTTSTTEFNSGNNTQVWISLMSTTGAGNGGIFDDVMIFEKVPESNDGYIKNGTFETGILSPWDNLWGSNKFEIIKGGKDDNFALNISSAPGHVRQMPIAVEANTDYKITLWSKNVNGVSLLVKDGNDTHNIVNKGIANSNDWAMTEITINTGNDTSILISFYGSGADAYGTFDNIVMEKLHTCEIVELERVDATCTTEGYVKYGCECGEGVYTETLTAKGHTWADATCTAPKTCSVCNATEGDALGHTYDNEFDADCNVCGDIRVVTLPIVKGGTSISEDVSGVAVKFNVAVNDLAVLEGTGNEADYTNATIDGYKLISMGVVATNRWSEKDIPCVYLLDLAADSAAYATRIINIPADYYDSEITFQSYFVVEMDDVAVTVNGESVITSYNSASN